MARQRLNAVRINVRLYKEDLDFLRRLYGQQYGRGGYNTHVREAVHAMVLRLTDRLRAMTEMPDDESAGAS